MTIVNVRRWVNLLLGTVILAASLPLAGQGGSADRAYNNGYQAGFKLGKADGQAGKPEDFAEVSTYRRATDGWKETDSGDLETYRTNFRAGYADGYKDGYKEARGSAPAKPPTPGRGGDRMILQPPASPTVTGEPSPAIATAPVPLTVAEGQGNGFGGKNFGGSGGQPGGNQSGGPQKDTATLRAVITEFWHDAN